MQWIYLGFWNLNDNNFGVENSKNKINLIENFTLMLPKYLGITHTEKMNQTNEIPHIIVQRDPT